MNRLPAIVTFLVIAACVAASSSQEKPKAASPEVILAKDGKALLNIYMVAEPPTPFPAKKAVPSLLEKSAADLRRSLQRLTGAEFSLSIKDRFPAGQPQPGVYIGQAKDFPWIDVPKNLEPEEFILRTTGNSLLLIGGGEAGVSDAIYALLEKCGCRWYFPGATWEVIPQTSTLTLALNDRQKPDISLQRRLAIGHGAHSPTIVRDYDDWQRRNRLPGTLQVNNSHSWPGISPEKDFAAHPEWFALVNGKRKPEKPCYAHPEVIARGVAQSLAYLEKNPKAQMVSVSAPDGADFCECELCRKQANVAKIYPAHGPAGLYGMTPEGKEVSIVSETIFHYTNVVADAVAKKYPGKYVGTIAYSAYSHPPSFPLRPNVYVEITQGYRRTPLTLAEQFADFGQKCKNLGLYEYYDVEQWSWDQPGKARAAQLSYHETSIPYFAHNHINSIKGEISNNWAPNGIGYYVLSKLMWDTRIEVRGVEEEFYHKAFGPAAAPLKRCYRRWESGQNYDTRTLGLAYHDLQEATQLTTGQPEYRARVDHIRLYLHFLKSFLPLKDFPLGAGENVTKPALARLTKRESEEKIKLRVDELGNYVRRLMDTHMVHSYGFNTYLKKVGNALGCDTKDWLKPGAIPTAAEIDKLFQEDLKDYDAAAFKEVEPRFFSRALVPLQETQPNLVTGDHRKMVCEPFRKGSLTVRAKKDESVSLSFSPAKGNENALVEVSFVSPDSFEKGWALFGGEKLLSKTLENGSLKFTAERDGYYQLEWTEASITALSHPAILRGGSEMGLRGATLSFFVPKGTRRFLLQPRVTGGPTFTLQDGHGKTILDFDRRKTPGAAPTEFVIEVPEGSDGGIWSLAGLRNGYGIGTIALVGVPNYFSLLPEQLLVPREVAR